jgi:DNA topoisomerase-1
MANMLVVVESPAKAKTIKKYLGKNYQVLASYGHVRDLLPKKGAVDTENDFAMKYVPIEKNEKYVAAISKALGNADELMLATDPDREGEAIAFHLHEMMKEKGLLKDKKVSRVVFYEFTKSAIIEAVAHPRELSDDLVNAQQARRALDYLVGFNLSPLLWKKIRRGLSAGRVQSPALRLIVERELEIEKFISQEYWSIEAQLHHANIDFTGKLIQFNGEKTQQFSFTSEEMAHGAVAVLKKAANGKLLVTKVEKKKRKKNPAAPFTTSTLQQEASRKMGFGTQRTMRIAQQLYEGIDIGEGSIGLISYMRTDSVNLSQTAIEELREVILEKYGQGALPSEPRVYKTKSKNAQEAHEAIRPTSANVIPDTIKSFLTPEQFKLYNLIWKRTVASQMESATLDTVAVDLQCGENHLFRANGSVVVDPGFMKVYEESLDDTKKEPDQKILPAMQQGDSILANDIISEQHFTEPPPRFSEATLVKALDEFGIGRPSTYAAIISTLQHREYVYLEAKRFYPTDVGRIVNKFLTNYFTQYVDYEFTARLEDELDAISRGEKQYKPVLKAFWEPFIGLIESTEASVQRKDVTQEQMDEACPKCGKPLSTRLGKRGRFVGCTAYPECDFTRSLNEEAESPEEAEAAAEIMDKSCPTCQKPLQIKQGKYGKFIGCSGYPDCKHIEPLEKPQDTKVACPECKQGSILKRKSRYGKIFYSCSRYPDCKYAIWNEPIDQACPTCEWPVTMIKVTKRKGTERVCPQKDCKFAEPYETEEELADNE